MPQTARQSLGQASEQLACDYLQAQGMQLVEQNFSCKLGEIDLIMRDQDALVFVEVRSRSHLDDYDPMASIDAHKQQRLKRAAQFYLQQKDWLDRYPCRFDAIGITYTLDQPQINWAEHIFFC